MTEPVQQNEQDDLRAFARVQTDLLMAVRAVPAGEQNSLQSHIHGPHLVFDPPPMEVRDTALAEWLNLLNKKLDAVLKLLEDREDSTAGLAMQQVLIGAGGIGFHHPAGLHVGDLVEFRLRLVVQKPLVLTIFGKIVETSPELFHARFLAMTDEIRDLIVRFVFQQEREIMLSQRKE